MKIALHPKEYILTKEDCQYLCPALVPMEFWKIRKISTETLMGAYRDVAIIWKKHAKSIQPAALHGYTNFMGVFERELKRRRMPRWKVDQLFTKESNYRRYF